MKDHYDFSKGKRGRVVAEPPLESAKVQGRLPDIDQFGAPRICRGENPEVGRDSAAHYPRGDVQKQRGMIFARRCFLGPGQVRRALLS